MARVAVPYDEIDAALMRRKLKPRSQGFYSYDTTRVYERIKGKFIPIGYRVISRTSIYGQDDFDLVIYDSELE